MLLKGIINAIGFEATAVLIALIIHDLYLINLMKA